MAKLTVDELRGLFAEEYGVTKKEAKEQLEGIFEFFEGILVEQKKGFAFGTIGDFDVVFVEAKDHNRRNPQTGESFVQHVEAHHAPKFKLAGGKTSVKARLKK